MGFIYNFDGLESRYPVISFAVDDNDVAPILLEKGRAYHFRVSFTPEDSLSSVRYKVSAIIVIFIAIAEGDYCEGHGPLIAGQTVTWDWLWEVPLDFQVMNTAMYMALMDDSNESLVSIKFNIEVR
jgi:hypothetical protein